MPRRDTPLSIEIPAPGADRPQWTQVGIVAAVGFVLGILWPRYTGTRIAPNPPSEPAAVSSQEAPVASVPGAAGSVAAGPSPVSAGAPVPDPGIRVGQGIIFRCRGATKDDVPDDCGPLLFDPVAVPKLKGLTQCPAAKGAAGKLSVALDVDFRRRKVRAMPGKRTTLPEETARGLLKCAQSAFDNVTLDEVSHKHRRYTLIYSATFGSAGNPSEPPPEHAPEEGSTAGKSTGESPIGSATVAWDVAILRDTPKSGAVVGRVVRGMKVKVLAQQGEWFKVRYGSNEGWTYRGALGL